MLAAVFLAYQDQVLLGWAAMFVGALAAALGAGAAPAAGTYVSVCGPQFETPAEVAWLAGYGVGYRVGIDGISVLMVLLSVVMMPLVVVVWQCQV